MSELTGVGSAEAGNLAAGGNGAVVEGSAAAAAATESRSGEPGNLDWAKAKGWVNDGGQLDTAKLADGYQSLEKRLGSMTSLPGETATPEERDAFAKQMGWPADPKGYEFARPAELPADIPYDEGMADRFKTWANEARLPKAQAQALHDQYVKQFAEDVQAYHAELQTKAEAAHKTLVTEWGAPGSEGYNKQKDAAIRALRSPAYAGLEAELKTSGLLTKDGVYTSPLVAKLLAQAGSTMQNDTLTGGSAGNSDNPFQKGTPAYSTDSIANLIRTDPDRARTLATAAGWHPDAIAAIGKK
ncbi:hypothetical protein UFOVP143_53 [uncultured Caudovirales phage]|uniref:Uncharacterized protein n=1 Tax=uncultured Caudovirales phage TaxID=2100421 RepID=A0A6J7VPG8_9CAUD|nr:hypothetical protein UFOVP143_53 [uncultured Caudovirales phage]